MERFTRLVGPQFDWLRRRATFAARQLGDGVPGGVEVVGDELYAEALLLATKNFSRWFEGPSFNEQARTREFLANCLRQAKSRILRQNKELLAPPGDEGGGQEPQDLERPTHGAGTERAHAEDEILSRVEAERAQGRILDAIAALTPNLRLSFLAVEFPGALAYEDVVQASKYRAGGADAVPRGPKQAWALFETNRERLLQGSGAAWKRFVGEVFCLDTPLGEANDAQIRTAVNRLDIHLHRARERLLEQGGRSA